jgi:hypothetical protein
MESLDIINGFLIGLAQEIQEFENGWYSRITGNSLPSLG